MALPVTITGLSTAVAPVGPFKLAAGTYGSSAPITSSAVGGSNLQLWGTTSAVARAQVFTNANASGLTIPSVTIGFGPITGSPTGDVYLEIRATDPNGSVLATSNSVTAASTASASVTFTFATPAIIAASATFAVVILRTAADAVNYITVQGNNSGTYPGGASWNNASGTWSIPLANQDLLVTVNGTLAATVASDKYFVFGRDSATATNIRLVEASDPTSLWVQSTLKTGFTTAILTLAAYRAGNVIHMLVCDGTAATSVATKYVSYDMVSGTFLATTETVAAAAANTGQSGTSPVGGALVVRSNGEVVAFYNGLQTKTSGTFRARVYYRRRTAVNTWSTETQVDSNTAVESLSPYCVLGAADRVHFSFTGGTTVAFRTLSAANALSAIVSGATSVAGPGTSYDRSGTTKVVWVCGASGPTIIRYNSADAPTITEVNLANANAVQPWRIGSDGTDVSIVYRLSTDSDLYSRKSTDDGATFAAAVSFFVGTVAAGTANLSNHDGEGSALFTRGNAVTLPYVVNDNGTLKYNENIVRYVATADAWNLNDRTSANLVLSNNDKTVAPTGAGYESIRSTQRQTNNVAGKYYVEFKVDDVTGSLLSVGIQSYLSGGVGSFVWSFSAQSNGPIAIESNQSGPNIGAWADGDVIGMAWDAETERVWFRRNNGLWNNDAGGDPAQGIASFDVSVIPAGEVVLKFGREVAAGGQITLRSKLADLTLQGPAGFKTWMGETIPQPSTADAWNVNDKSASITLSSSDKKAAAAATDASVRTTKTYPSGAPGKYYAEFVAGAVTTSGISVGICQTSSSINSNIFGAASIGFWLRSDGAFFQNGTQYGSTWSSWGTNDVVCLAYDTETELGWVRYKNADWNFDPSANPSTGVGGIPVSALTGAVALGLATNSASVADLTIRTTKAEFTQTTPAGFKSWMGETLITPDYGALTSGTSSLSAVGTVVNAPAIGTGALVPARATTTSSGISGSSGAPPSTPIDVVIAGAPVGPLDFGDNYTARTGQSFTSVGNTVTKVRVQLYKQGAPSDGVWCRVSTADANGFPLVSLGLSAVVPGSSLTTTAAAIDFTFTPPVQVNKGQRYAAVIERTGAGDNQNYYDTIIGENVYPGGDWVYDSFGWMNQPYDLVATISQVLVGTLQGASSSLTGTQPPPITGTATLTTQNCGLASFQALSSSSGTGALTILQARTNLARRSQEMDQAPWFKTNATVAADTAMAPDSTMTAEQINDGVTYNQHYVGLTFSSVASATHTISVYVKPESLPWFQIQCSSQYANFNLTTGVIGQTTAGVAANMESVGNGWYRCSLTAVLSASATAYLMLLDSDLAAVGPNYTNYQGSNRTLLLWGLQCELGNVATAYIPTQAAAVTINQGGPALTGIGQNGWSGSGALDVSVNREQMGRVATVSSHTVGQDATLFQMGQSFIATTGQLNSMNLTMATVGSPTDGVSVQVYNETMPATVLGQPSDTIAVRGGTITSYKFTFSPPINLVAGNSYSFAVARTGALDASNFYRLRADNDVYAGGALLRLASGSWSVVTPAYDAAGWLEFGNNNSRLAGVGLVESPAVSGTGVLTTGISTLASVGNVRWVATGALPPTNTNLIPWSEQLDNASYWTKWGVVLTTDATVAPDSTTTAELVLGDGSSDDWHQVWIPSPPKVPAAGLYTESVYIKAGTGRWARLANGISSIYANFDLINGVVGFSAGVSNVTITPVGNGWFRCSWSFSAVANDQANPVMSVIDQNYNGNIPYNTTSTSHSFWGVQVNPGLLQPYLKTASTGLSIGFTTASLVGTGFVGTFAVGALASSAAVLSGAGTAANIERTGTGTLTSGIAALFANGASSSTGNGAVNDLFITSDHQNQTTFGSDSPTDGVGQTFVSIGSVITQVTLLMSRAANPIDAATVKIWTAVGDLPGTLLATSDPIPGSSFTTNNYTIPFTFTFPAPVAVTNGVKYVVTVQRTGAVDNNFYVVAYNDSDAYAPGQMIITSQGNWSNLAAGYDLWINIGQSYSRGLQAGRAPLVGIGASVTPPATGTGALTSAAISRGNLFQWSQAFDQSDTWNPSGLNVAADSVQAPDGTMTADRVTETGFGYHTFLQFGYGVSGPLTQSIYAKAGATGDWIRVWLSGTVSDVWANFNLRTGQIGSVSGEVTPSITAAANGFYRCVISSANAGQLSNILYFSLLPNDSLDDQPYYPSGSRDIIMWGAQFETGLVAKAYVPTTTAPVNITETLIGAGAVGSVQTSAALTPSSSFANGVAQSRSVSTSATLTPALALLAGIGLGATASGTGALAAATATLVATGAAVYPPITGTGTLTTSTSTLAGFGSAVSTGTGVLTPAISNLIGTGSGILAGSGALTNTPAVAAGSGISSSRSISANLQSQSNFLKLGDGLTGSVGTAPLTVQTSTMVATGGRSISTGTGALAGDVSTLAGAGTTFVGVTGSGLLTTVAALAAAGISGSSGAFGVLPGTTSTMVALGAALSSGSGVLPGAVSTLAAAGVAQMLGSGTLASQAGVVTSAGLARWLATGTLNAPVCSLSGSGQVSFAASGVINATASTVSGAGVSSTRSTSALLQASIAFVSGFEGVTIISGTGSMPSQSAQVAGAGRQTSLGTGALAGPAAALAGAGLSRGLGTGVLPSQACAIAAAGVSGGIGTGAIVATVSAISGGGAAVDKIEGTGALASQVVGVSGIGSVVLGPTGTGALLGVASSVAGAGTRTWNATGSLTGQAAALTATGKTGWTGTGALAAGGSAISGAGQASWTGTGVLSPGVSDISANGVSGSLGTVTLAASRSFVLGAEGVVVISGAGDLQGQSCKLVSNGVGRSFGAGSLPVLDSAYLVGSGTSRSVGAGTLTNPNRSVLSGEGGILSLGSGVLTSVSSVAGAGYSRWVGGGVLPADLSRIASQGVVESRATGVLKTGLALIASSGRSEVKGTGTLAPGRAQLHGTADLTTFGAGVLEAGDAKTLAVGLSASRGTGALKQDNHALDGDLVSGSRGTGVVISKQAVVVGSGLYRINVVGTGVLAAKPAKVVGWGVETAYGDGDLQPLPANVNGNDLIAGDGILDAAACAITGEGLVEASIMPPVTGFPGSYPGTRVWRGYTAQPTLPPPPWWRRGAA